MINTEEICGKFHAEMFDISRAARAAGDHHAASVSAYIHDRFISVRRALRGDSTPYQGRLAPYPTFGATTDFKGHVTDPQLTMIDFRWRSSWWRRHTVHMRRFGCADWTVLGRFWTLEAALQFTGKLRTAYSRGVEDGWHKRAIPVSAIVAGSIQAGSIDASNPNITVDR